MAPEDLVAAVEDLVRGEDHGVAVRIDLPGTPTQVVVHGLADRARGLPIEEGTVFGTASVTKGITALTVMRLVEEGTLALSVTARSLLGDDLPLVSDLVTVEDLLAHRSGIGDYLDEEAQAGIDDYVMTVPSHRLDSIQAHLPLLDGRPQRTEPGQVFRYNNSGFVLLALLAERAATTPFHDLASELVLRPAGMARSAFLRSDTPVPDGAVHYLMDGRRTNVLHMPLVGGGDGGLHSTLGDLHALWDAVADGRVVTEATWFDMRTARTPAGSEPGAERVGYGLGTWLAARGVTYLEGYDAGISARTLHRPSDGATATVLSNSSEGAWPVAALLLEALTTG